MSKRTFKRLLFPSPSVASGKELDLKRSDFDFERSLGEGAFGKVWKVRHKASNEHFALKQVPKDRVLKMLPQFKREVYLLYNMDHCHVVQLFNHFEDEKNFYLVMQLAAGGNLFTRLHKQRQFMELEAAQYFREIVLAVEYLHSHVPAIIHRDIKPENILLDKDSRVVLTDFGWSNYSGAAQPRTTVCGTLEYLPPEMVEEKEHDTSVDVWCLGVLLYEMLVGYSPFKSQAKRNILLNISKCKPEFPLSFPLLAKDLVLKLLTKDSHERLKISEVKVHRWLTDIPVLRPTPAQHYELIPLPCYNEGVPVSFKSYKVLNPSALRTEEEEHKSSQDSELSELTLSDSEEGSELGNFSSVLLLEDLVCKQSIKQFQAHVDEKRETIVSAKGQIVILEQDLSVLLSKEQELEGLLLSKSEELNLVTQQQQQTREDLNDTEVKLLNFNSSPETVEILNNTHALNAKLQEQTEGTHLARERATVLTTQLGALEAAQRLREAELRSSQDALERLKTEHKGHTQNEFDQLNELEIQRDILRAHLSKSDSLSSELCEEDSMFLRELTTLIRKRLSECFAPELAEPQLREKLHNITEQNNAFESVMAELLRAYEFKKSYQLKTLRKHRDELTEKRKIQQRKKEALGAFKQAHTVETLNERLQELRTEEKRAAGASAELASLRKHCESRRFAKNSMFSRIENCRNERKRCKKQVSVRESEQEELLLELNEIKMQVGLREFAAD